MIGKLFSSVLTRGPARAESGQPAQAPSSAASSAQVSPAPAPAPAPAPVAAPPDVASPGLAATPAPADADADAEAAARAEFLRRRESDRAMAQTWMQGQLLLKQLLADPALADPRRLERHGRKAYSQHDEDGILAEIFRRIGIHHRSFVEFGCGDGLENNTAYLLAQGWRGLWIDGDERNAGLIAHGFAPLLAHGLLQFRRAFITRDNIDGLIASANLGPEIDLLSIDVDGNDHDLWNAIACVSARVVTVEYNAKFWPPFAWRIAYDAGHSWQGDDYMGASLAALEALGRAKGYRLVGCNLAGANAFFVRADLAGELFAEPSTAEHLYQPARYELGYAYRGGHGAASQSIVWGACMSAGIAVDMAGMGVTYKPENL